MPIDILIFGVLALAGSAATIMAITSGGQAGRTGDRKRAHRRWSPAGQQSTSRKMRRPAEQSAPARRRQSDD